MEIFCHSADSKRAELIKSAQTEILLLLPSLESCESYIKELSEQKKCSIKIIVRRGLRKNALFKKISSLGIQVKSASFLPRNFSCGEICIVDGKSIMITNGLLKNRCVFLYGQESSSLREHFHDYWKRLGIWKLGCTFAVRSKKFYFSSGRNSSQTMLQNISMAENEVLLFSPKISKHTMDALLSAKKRGAQVKLHTLERPYSLVYKWRARQLVRSGVKVHLQKHAFQDYLALVDSKNSYLGNAKRGQGRHETVFGFFDPSVHEQLLAIFLRTGLLNC